MTTTLSHEALAPYRGRLALVTGAGAGIGAMLARELATAGMEVLVQDIREDAAGTASAAIRAAGGKAEALAFDVSDRDACLAAAEALRGQGRRLALLWINAGVGVGASLLEGSARTVEWAYGVNALGMVWTAQAFGPLLEAWDADPEAETGAPLCHVGFAASSASVVPPAAPLSLYAATKHASMGIAEGLRDEFAARGIGSTVLCPGLLNTDIWDGARARPDRFGGPRRMDPSINTPWREAALPEAMWPHIAATVSAGGGYALCLTDPATRDRMHGRTAAFDAGTVHLDPPG